VTNRVVVGPLPGGGSGLRVSRPGFNVLDTNLTGKQLAFDSRWATTARVFATGIHSAQANGLQTIGYGVNFTTIPPAFVWRKHATEARWYPLVMTFGLLTIRDPFTPESGGPLMIYPDRIEFGAAAGNVFRYLILRPY